MCVDGNDVLVGCYWDLLTLQMGFEGFKSFASDALLWYCLIDSKVVLGS